jgi:hypothetical protein
MSPFIYRYLGKKLKEIRQKPTSTNWSNNINRNCWDLLQEHLSQRGANGLIVDAARRLGKKSGVHFLVKLLIQSHSPCLLLRAGRFQMVPPVLEALWDFYI